MLLTTKKWWAAVLVATLALEILCLAISPNPLSIVLIPVGTALVGGGVPTGLGGLRQAANDSLDSFPRLFGLAIALFCLGVAWVGLRLIFVAIVVALAVLGWKL